MDTLKLLRQALRVALLVVVFKLLPKRIPGQGHVVKLSICILFFHIKGQGMSCRQRAKKQGAGIPALALGSYVWNVLVHRPGTPK